MLEQPLVEVDQQAQRFAGHSQVISVLGKAGALWVQRISMTLNRHAFLLLLLASLLSACGDDDGGGPAPQPTSTVAATATASSLPSSTATSAPTSTSTSLPTSTATPEPTSTLAPSATETETPLPAGATALFHLDALDPGNPFPSDRLRDESGHVAVTGPLIGADLPPEAKYDTARNLANVVAGQLEQVTGFSTFAPVRVKFDATVVAPEEGAGAFLLSCSGGEVPIRVRATDFAVSGDDALEIYPLVPLRPKAFYIYAVTRDVLDADGKNVAPSAELLEALESDDQGISAWRESLQCGLDLLAQEHGIGVDDLAVIDGFTTQPTTDDLLAIKDRFAAGELPIPVPVFENSPINGLVTGIFDEGTPEFEAIVGSPTSEHIAKVAVGSFASLDFRKDGSAFDPDFVVGDGIPPAVHLDFHLTIPKAAAPEGGYPIVIFGHGLGGSSRDVVGASRLFGGEPLMGIGISAVQHGRRGNVGQFFNLVDGFATREHFRQTVVDLMQLALMIRNSETAPFDLVNDERVHYFGISLGGIMGTLFMGVDPNVRVGVLSVPGGGLPNIIQSEAIGALLKPLISLTVGIPQADPNFPAFFHRFTHLSQWVIDAGDPINTAPVILDAENTLPGVPVKRILMQEGVVDTVVPNETTEDLARAMGIPDAKATLGCQAESGCSGLWRYVMTEYGQAENSGHSVTGIVPQAGAQVAEFLISDGTHIRDASPVE